MSTNVYKPIVQGVYTRTASPDFTPPAITRVGRLVHLDTSTLTTHTLYTRPEGKRARLIYFLIYTIEAGPSVTCRLNGSQFFYLYPSATYLNEVPLLNQTYETGIEITSSLTVQLQISSNQVKCLGIVVEEDIVNN